MPDNFANKSLILILLFLGVDTRIKFSIEPPSTGENAYIQWVDAMKGVARLPLGIPEEFRKKVRSTN